MHSLLSSVVERVTSNDEVSRSNRLGGKTNAYPSFLVALTFSKLETRSAENKRQIDGFPYLGV
jgi:hypothetical protein